MKIESSSNPGLGGSELVKRSALAWLIASKPARILGSASRAVWIACSRVNPRERPRVAWKSDASTLWGESPADDIPTGELGVSCSDGTGAGCIGTPREARADGL